MATTEIETTGNGQAQPTPSGISTVAGSITAPAKPAIDTNGLAMATAAINEKTDYDKETADLNKKRRSQQLIADVAQGINNLRNIYFTTKGAPNMAPGNLSQQMSDRWDKFMKEREANHEAKLKAQKEDALTAWQQAMQERKQGEEERHNKAGEQASRDKLAQDKDQFNISIANSKEEKQKDREHAAQMAREKQQFEAAESAKTRASNAAIAAGKYDKSKNGKYTFRKTGSLDEDFQIDAEKFDDAKRAQLLSKITDEELQSLVYANGIKDWSLTSRHQLLDLDKEQQMQIIASVYAKGENKDLNNEIDILAGRAPVL